MRRLLASIVAATLAATTLAVAAPPAEAAFPGGIGKIVFVSDRDHPSEEIYVRDFAGSAATRITTNTARDLGPRWSPDGTKIAFYSLRGGTWEISTINADSTGETGRTPSFRPGAMRVGVVGFRTPPTSMRSSESSRRCPRVGAAGHLHPVDRSMT